MANNLKIQGLYLVVTDTGTGEEKIRMSKGKARFVTDTSDNFYFLTDEPTEKQLSQPLAFADFIDDRTGLAFASVDELKEFLSNEVGFFLMSASA